jgi:two-component system chemotaxis sensor kinase CheA
MDLAKYRAMFVTEAQEHLRQMNAGLVALESDPADPERIQGLFRSAHSIKGMAASVGYDAIAALSHRLEDLMDRYRQGGLAVEPAAIDLLLEGVDLLTHHVQAIADNAAPEHTLEPLVAKLGVFLGAADRADTSTSVAPASLPSAGDATSPPSLSGTNPSLPPRTAGGEPLRGAATSPPPSTSAAAPRPAAPPSSRGTGRKALLKVDVVIAGGVQAARVRAFMVHRRLAELGTIVACVPSAADLRSGQGEFDGRLSAALETVESAERVRAALRGMPDVASVTVESATRDAAGGAAAAPAGRPAPEAARGADAAAAAKPRITRTVKVQTDLLDSFVNMAGELLVVESRLKEVTRDLDLPAVKESTATLGKLVRGLHAQIMTVRMMPLSAVSEGLSRTVRDLAKREDKEVAFAQEGTGLEFDRSVLEELPDLLTHLLRNAVDHGLEPAAEREGARKPKRGQIWLRAFRQKDKAVVQVEDDGRGMDPAKLRAKAVERGQITDAQAAAMTDAEALYLCCLPGLSTARQVTDVSGRGVGMDAVRTRVEALGGALVLESKPGKGTRISLHLPTSVAIVQVLLLGIDGEVFAVPVTRVLRTLELAPHEIEMRGRQLLFRFDEEDVPLLSLRKILRLPAPETRGRLLTVAVVQVRQRTVGLVVDRFVGQQEAFVKPLPRPLASIDGVAGVTILGDGRAIFVLDTENLF